MNIKYFPQAIIFAVMLFAGSLVSTPVAQAETAVLGVTQISAVQTFATANNTFADGWKWVFDVTLPANENVLNMRFADWTGLLGNIPVSNNLQFYSPQSLNASDEAHSIVITTANTYSDPMLLTTSDLDLLKAGQQIQIIVEMKIPVGSGGGSYSTSYGLRSGASTTPTLDTTAPVITPPADQYFTAEGLTTTPTLVPATATDDLDSSPIITYSPHDFPVGMTPVIWTATDASGNFATATSKVIISEAPGTTPDLVLPVITLLGTSPLEVVVGNSYLDAGATALDDVDGDITSSIIVTSNVNTAVVGNYTVTYTVFDLAGNQALPVSRVVNVVPAATEDLSIYYVNPVDDLYYSTETPLESISLPVTLDVILSDSSLASYPVTWDGGTPSYDPSTAGTYIFTGTLILPSGVTNPSALAGQVRIFITAPSE